MKSRELAAVLKVLKAAGVQKATLGDVSVEFRDEPVLLVPAGDAETIPDGEDMKLPDGMFDPRDMLAKINRRARSQ